MTKFRTNQSSCFSADGLSGTRILLYVLPSGTEDRGSAGRFDFSEPSPHASRKPREEDDKEDVRKQ